MLTLAVACLDERDEADAELLSVRLELPFAGICPDPRQVADWRYLLMIDADVLQIVTTGKHAPGPVLVDFSNARLQNHRCQAGGQRWAAGEN